MTTKDPIPTSAARIPERTTADHEVVVVGLGPVGGVAAGLLAREGLRVLAVEPLHEPYDKPRALGIDHEALRTLQALGLGAALEDCLGPYRTSEYRSADGQVLRRIRPQPEPHPLSWPPYNTFIQPELESRIRASLAQWPNLEVRYGWKCVGITQDADGASVDLVRVDGGERHRTRCRYVVACDGASSPVRETAGLALEDLDFDEPWIVVDLLVNERAALPEVTIQYCDPARPATYVEGPRNLRRWELMLLPGEDPAVMQAPAQIWKLLSPWITPDQGEIWRSATYRFHALVCRQWRGGRVFLAGDAAHQTPPFMAQGMNQGIRDAANLCWKLADVLRDRAAPGLLDTYERERRPNVHAVIALTKRLGQIICERDPARAAARDARLLAEMRAGTGDIVRQDLLPPLDDGFLMRDARGRLLPGVGRVFPQPMVECDGGVARMDDALGARWLLVGTSAWRPGTNARRLASRLDVVLACVDGDRDDDGDDDGDARASGIKIVAETSGLIRDWLAAHDVHAALVRPDHIVFGTAAGPGAQERLLAALADAR